MNIKKHNGYQSCWTCLIFGETHEKTRVFPYKLGDKHGMRDSGFYEYCNKQIEEKNLLDFGGHKGRSCILEMPLPGDDSVVHDSFHVVVGQ